jgi:hypothetical protein
MNRRPITPCRSGIALAAVFALALACAFSAPTRAQETDPDGYLFINGTPPRAFANIDHIAIFRDTPGAPRKGWIQLKDKRSTRFAFRELTASGTKFSFTTAAVGGINYSFRGEFQVAGVLAETQPTGVVLKGHLTKWRGRRQAAESEVSLIYSVGD